MENFRCITVGINRYQFFPPLNYAQGDAQALYQFLQQMAAFPLDRCLLLTDTAAKVGGKSTYPTRDNLFFWLNYLRSNNSSSLGRLWFFFKGYGINHQGEDYLLTLDSHPQDIINTSISMRSLLTLLQQQGASEILLLFDLYYPLGKISFGEETLALAKQMGMGVILSYQSEELSASFNSLNQGLFTTTLLEALQYYQQEITLAKLETYLSDRFQEISIHYWRTFALPIIASPSLEFSHIPLLKNSEKSRLQWTNFSVPFSPQSLTMVEEKTLDSPSKLSIASPTSQPENVQSNLKISKPNKSKNQFLVGILGIILIIFFAIFMRFKPVNFQQNNPIKIKNQELLNQARNHLRTNQASRLNQAIGIARQIKPNQPLYQEAQNDIIRWSEVILDIAQGRAKAEDFQGAILAAQLVPTEPKNLFYLSQKYIKEWEVKNQQKQNNQAVFEAVKSIIKKNQPVSYYRAILILQNISMEEGGYLEAQKLIQQWGHQIYLIAHSRAAQGKFKQAIKIAELVPPNTSSYPLSRKAIKQWQNKLEKKN